MYYTLPFDCGNILAGGNVPASTLHENIAQHLHLVITTRFGENRNDLAYGNAIWDLEFENGISNEQWEEQFTQAVTKAINEYESRLTNVQVKIHSAMVEKSWPLRNFTEIKKKVTVLVSAILADTGEKYMFKTDVFLSPMSTD